MKLFINAYLYYLMATEINNIKLKFNCPANWEEMQQLDGCRFCSHCQKKVYDFTGSTQAEFERISAGNGNQICGRFRADHTIMTAKSTSFLRRWLTAALVLLGFNVIACKDQPKTAAVTKKVVPIPPAIKCVKNPDFLMGEPLPPTKVHRKNK